MEKNNAEEEHDSNERLRKQLGVDPDEFLETVRKYMELHNRHFLLKMPLIADLKLAMKELFEKQYPAIKPYIHIWHINWIFEAMELTANTLAIRLVNFFETVDQGKDYKAGYTNYEQCIERYTKPYEARKGLINYSKLQLNAEQLRIYEQVVEDAYQEDLIEFVALNRDRDDFLNCMYQVALKYFNIQFDYLTPDQLVHYNIIAGMGYEDYFETCKELNHYLIKDKIQEYPGMGFSEFMTIQDKKCFDRTQSV